MAHLAAQTERLLFSTATTLITTTDPVRLAEDYAYVQHLTDGRVDLTLGRGNTGPVYPGSAKICEQEYRWRWRTTRCCTGCGARRA